MGSENNIEEESFMDIAFDKIKTFFVGNSIKYKN